MFPFRFPALLRELDDKRAQLYVDGYGISVTTLEEVFLAVTASAAAEHADVASSPDDNNQKPGRHFETKGDVEDGSRPVRLGGVQDSSALQDGSGEGSSLDDAGAPRTLVKVWMACAYDKRCNRQDKLLQSRCSSA